jgi:amino-acid N-acetyltransferase
MELSHRESTCTAQSDVVPRCPASRRLAVRRACRADAKNIHALIDSMTADGTLLRRSLSEIEQHCDTFVVAELLVGPDKYGPQEHGPEKHDACENRFLGCAALHRYGAHLAEIRSIAVRPEARGLGAGGMLLEQLLRDVAETGTQCACLFTRIPGFFEHYGFHNISLAAVPDKVAKDCVRCPRRDACDEIAMALGELPVPLPTLRVARQLVQL